MNRVCLDCHECFYVEHNSELKVCPYCWSERVEEIINGIV